MSVLDVVAPLLLGALQLGIAEGALPNKFLIFILREIHIKYLFLQWLVLLRWWWRWRNMGAVRVERVGEHRKGTDAVIRE